MIARVALLAAWSVVATTLSAGGITARDRADCRADVRRFCPGADTPDRAAVACLMRHRAELSPRCTVAFRRHGA